MQTEYATKNFKIFFLVTTATIIALFLTLNPHINTKVFAHSREKVFQEFIKDTSSKGNIDPKEFWKLREFYSPDYFTYQPSGFTTLESSQLDFSPLILSQDASKYIFLQKKSKHLVSKDALVENEILNSYFDTSSVSKSDLIFAKDQSLIFNKENTKYILFIKSVDELKSVNGFFNYGNDPKLFDRKYWLSVTKIQ